MFSHRHQKRVRYGETDQMGYFYYGNYAQLYEIGRAEAIRTLGITYQELESELKIMMPVLEMNCRYRGPLKYDELMTIETILTEMPTKLIHFYHNIYNMDGKLVHKGEVKLFFVDMESNKRVSCPSYLSDKLLPFFETKD